MPFTKRNPGAPAEFYEAEAAGLRWLGEADGGVPVGEVLQVTATSITLTRYPTIAPNRYHAVDFGRRLALTHRAGAAHHGSPPPKLLTEKGNVDAGAGGGATGIHGFIGPLPLPHLAEAPQHWGEFYANCRLEPFARAAEASGALDARAADDVRAVIERLLAGDSELAGPEPLPARLHGDLWGGNVLWTAQGARLIDPAAHGGHPETDLAMLALFGLPYLDDVLAAYDSAAPLSEGWKERVGLHQLHPLLVHAVLFGPSFGAQAGQIARRYR
jgi:fructosamine-3-kinase